jgi:hypothetical protein
MHIGMILTPQNLRKEAAAMDKPGQAWSLRQLKPPKGLTVLQIASSDQVNVK